MGRDTVFRSSGGLGFRGYCRVLRSPSYKAFFLFRLAHAPSFHVLEARNPSSSLISRGRRLLPAGREREMNLPGIRSSMF